MSDEYEDLARQLIGEFESMHRFMSTRVSNAVSGEMAVMRALMLANGELTPSQIADRAWVSTPRVANILRSLEAKNWITREPDKTDRRRVIVKVTKHGLATLEEKRALSNRKTGEFLAELGPDDARELVRLVHRMSEIVEKNQGTRLRDILCSENPKPKDGFSDTSTTND